MNNNLAETLKSIGIIGSLKPTSNNSQVKQQQQQQQVSTKKNTKSKQVEQPQQQVCTQNTNSSQSNSKNIVETQSIECGSTVGTTKPLNKTNDITSSPSHFAMFNHNKISSFNNRFKQQTAEFKQQYDLIEHKFKQILNNERKCLASTSPSSASSSTSSSSTFLFSKENNKETDKNNNSKELVRTDKQVVDEDEEEDEEEEPDDDDDQEEDNYEYLENENKTTNKKVSVE